MKIHLQKREPTCFQREINWQISGKTTHPFERKTLFSCSTENSANKKGGMDYSFNDLVEKPQYAETEVEIKQDWEELRLSMAAQKIGESGVSS